VGCLGVVGTAQKIEFGEGGCTTDLWNRGREGNGGGGGPAKCAANPWKGEGGSATRGTVEGGEGPASSSTQTW
jgi:hypothetical protein